MKLSLLILLVALCVSATFAQNSLTSLDALNQAAQQKLNTQSNVPLADTAAEFMRGTDVLEAGKIPNYVRGMALLPNAAKPFAATFKAYLFGGTIAPEIKMAMGLRIAQVYGSAYPAIHLQRLLRASSKGEIILSAMQKNDLLELPLNERIALFYADFLARDIKLITDGEFMKARAYYNDSQLVELTMTTAFFNYFLRYCEGANLPVEKWAIEEPIAKISAAKYEAPAARVALVSNEQIIAGSEALAAANAQAKNPNGLGIGMANSQRAFLLVPDITKAWRAFTNTSREYNTVSREIKLHVSFAISMLNGCRYCTLHQVQGLRRLNVDPTKLMAMAKDDAALTPRELTAVVFARKITSAPA